MPVQSANGALRLSARTRAATPPWVPVSLFGEGAVGATVHSRPACRASVRSCYALGLGTCVSAISMTSAFTSVSK